MTDKNFLYYGDNLDILRNKIRDDTVDLCYIDPPFNSKRNYSQIYNNIGKEDIAQAQAFIDMWTWDEQAIAGYSEIITCFQGRYTRQTIELIKGLKAVLGESSLLAYIISITQRVNEIQRVLKPTGSFYLHCDPTASHYLKLVLDSVFCSRGGDYINEIVWKRSDAHNDAKQGVSHFGRIHDVLFFYRKSVVSTFNALYDQLPQSTIDKWYRHIEPETGRRYNKADLTGPGGAAKGNPFYEWNGKTRYWRYSQENMEKLEKEGKIVYSKSGMPYQKRYLDESKGVSVQDWWDDIKMLRGIHRSGERLGYPTQKPEALLERIIRASSNEGDLVLDAYCGCGTTVAVSQRLNRRWIGIDITYQSIAVILQRLDDHFGSAISDSVILDGIPRDIESARALANKKDDRVRKEFEIWAVLTYSNNRAAINNKKGADKGIDGMAYLVTGKDITERVLFQVKSGGVKRNDIATLRGDMERENAVIGIFITLEEPTKPMKEEAASAGSYYHELLNKSFPRIKIVTIREMIEDNARIDLPMSVQVLKTAAQAEGETMPLFEE